MGDLVELKCLCGTDRWVNEPEDVVSLSCTGCDRDLTDIFKRKRDGKTKYLYRFNDDRGGVYEETYEVISFTPKGFYIWDYFKPKWIGNGSGKRFAHATRELAWESYRMRKKRQVEILRARLLSAMGQEAYTIRVGETPPKEDTKRRGYQFHSGIGDVNERLGWQWKTLLKKFQSEQIGLTNSDFRTPLEKSLGIDDHSNTGLKVAEESF